MKIREFAPKNNKNNIFHVAQEDFAVFNAVSI